MRGTRVAVVRHPGQTGAETRRIEAALRTERLQVSRVTLGQAPAAFERGPAPAAVVTTPASMGHDRWESVIRVSEEAGIPVVIALPTDDLAASRSVFAAGAAPWFLDAPLDVAAIDAAADPASAAVEAVRDHLDGRHASAYARLHAVARSAEPDDGLEALILAGALALERFRERAGHPVPFDVLAAHLEEQTGGLSAVAYSWWWTMTEHIVFRSAGVALPPVAHDSPVDHVLSGAFHAASTIVRFTARRQWRLPRDFFDDLVLDPSDAASAAQGKVCAKARLEPADPRELVLIKLVE